MNGSLIPLFPKTRFDFTFLTMNATQQTVLAPAVDLIQFKTLILLIRIHRVTTMTTGQSFVYTLLNTLPSDEDPQEFTDTGTAITTLSIPTASAPSLLNSTGSSPQAFGKLVLTATQTGANNIPFYAEMSGCLLGRYQ